MTVVFFRDDDVGERDTPLENVVELLLEESIPCSYQVVPRFLTGAGATYMKKAQTERPGLVILNQHGLVHEQEINGKLRYSEFDGCRPYAEQRKAIESGRLILGEKLGESFDGSVFTPPCHKYDANTLRALTAAGITTLSAGVKVGAMSTAYYAVGSALGRVSLLGKRVSYHGDLTPGGGLAEVSVCIDVDEDVDRQGEKIEKSYDDLVREFERCRSSLSTVGVMLHHGKCEGRRVDTLRAFVKMLKADPTVELRTLNQIAADARAQAVALGGTTSVSHPS